MTTRFTKLPKLLLDTMAAMRVINNVPEEMSIQAVLGVANFATHAHYDIDPEYFGGNTIPSSEYFVALAPTAGAKSTVYKMLSNGIAKFEEEARARYQTEKENYDLAYSLWEKEYRAAVKTLTDFDRQSPGIMKKFNEDNKPPQHPSSCNFRIGKATVNGVIDTLKLQPYAGLFSSEAGDFFNSHAFQDGKNGSKGLEMLTTLTNAWDGHTLERNTGVDQTKLYNRRFNMLFMLQAAMAKDWLSNPLYSDQGFVHRLLITQCNEWEMPDLDPARLPEIEKAKLLLQPFHDRVYQLLSKPLRFKEGSNLELEPMVMLVDRPALQILSEFANKIKAERVTKYKDWDGFASRAYEHALRISATLAAFDEKEFIDLDSAEAGIELMEFYLEQRLGLELGATSKNPNQVRVAKKLLEWFKAKKEGSGFVAHNRLTKFGPSCYRELTVDEREGVIQELISRDEIAIESVDTGGTRKEIRYQILV